MECWSVDKKGINPSPITPALHYSNIPKLVVIERSLDGVSSFGL
jgi:hypothetical protein